MTDDSVAAAKAAVDVLRRGHARSNDQARATLADAHDLLAVVVRTVAPRGWHVALHPSVEPSAGAYVTWTWNLDGPQGQMHGGTEPSFPEVVAALYDTTTSMRA